jgi:hypothetical protein
MTSRIISKFKSAFDLVFIIPKHEFDNKLDRDRFASVSAMSEYLKQHDGRLVQTGPGWPMWDETTTATENLKTIYPQIPYFDLALLYEAQDILGIKELSIMKVITCNEMYKEKMMRKHASCNPDYFILHHTTEQERIEVITGIRTIHIPHGSDPTVYYPSDCEKKYDFILIGNLSPKVYPLRVKFKKVIERLNKNGYKCHIHSHPGYRLDTPTVEMHKFADSIRSAKIALTCSSIYKYRLSKYSEVPLCGTALAADLPKDGASFFEKFIILIQPEDSLEHIYNTLVKALPKWKEYAEKGRQASLQTSLQSHYAERFFDTYETFASK